MAETTPDLDSILENIEEFLSDENKIVGVFRIQLKFIKIIIYYIV